MAELISIYFSKRPNKKLELTTHNDKLLQQLKNKAVKLNFRKTLFLPMEAFMGRF